MSSRPGLTNLGSCCIYRQPPTKMQRRVVQMAPEHVIYLWSSLNPNGQAYAATMAWDRVEIVQQKDLSHGLQYPISKPTMFVNFGVRHAWNPFLVIFWSSCNSKMWGSSNRCSHTRLNHGLKKNNFLKRVDASRCGKPTGKI